MIKVCLSGIGRTGSEIAKTILEQKDMKLVAAFTSPGSSKIGKDLGEILMHRETGVIVESSAHLEETILKTRPDVVVDFSKPQATLENAKTFAKLRVRMVIGTTGFTKSEIRKLYILCCEYNTGILYAPNITLGVNVLMMLTNLAANILNEYDFQVTEIHHKQKKDAPSGTALKIAGEIEKGLNLAGNPIENADIPISAVRAGGVIGKHNVMIIGEDDKIEISHESFSRKAFALGTLKGIRFINGKHGYFEMSDVLDLKRVLNDYLQTDNKFFESQPACHSAESIG